jgi:methionine-rich copper-binding protein CopC
MSQAETLPPEEPEVPGLGEQHRRRRWLPVLLGVVGAITVIAVALAVGSTREPAQLVSTGPAAGAQLTTAPTEVTLTFSAPLDARDTHVVVLDPEGNVATVGEIRVTGQTVARSITVTTQGVVTVAYHARFQDGQQLNGSHRFTVGRASGPTPPIPAVPGAPVGGGGAGGGHVHPLGPVAIGLTALVLVVGTVVLVTGSRRGARRRGQGPVS